MAEKLKPCPFCGGEAKLKHIRPIIIVMCKNCGYAPCSVSDYMEEGDNIGDIKKIAIEAWNRRAGEQ